jgi:hypothetical protein
VNVNTGEFGDLRLSYAQHVYKAQGRTVERAFVLTGGWRTDRERAYVALTRARDRTDLYVSREDLGEQGMDAGAIERLADAIAQSNAQQPSIATPAIDRPSYERASPDPSESTDHAFEQANPSGLWAAVGADPPPGPDTGHQGQQRESEAAQIMRDQQHDRERGVGWEIE